MMSGGPDTFLASLKLFRVDKNLSKFIFSGREAIKCLTRVLRICRVQCVNDFLRHVLTFLDSAMELNLFYLKTKLDDKEKCNS